MSEANGDGVYQNGKETPVRPWKKSEAGDLAVRTHPQWTFLETEITPTSFFGQIRAIYSSEVLKSQLEQLRRSGCYDMFTGKWMSCYDTRRTSGGKIQSTSNGLPPSLFWESDIGKWIEATSYFLASPTSTTTKHATEFKHAVNKLIGEIKAFQQSDGYLNVYFTLVDPEGRFRNLRDMHEMYNAGHLLEGAIAHYRWTGSREFLDVMIKNVNCFMTFLGPNQGQLRGYPGHPEFELAVLRLYAITQDPRHLEFAKFLLSARGTSPAELGGQHFFMWEAQQREDLVHGCWMKSLDDLAYHQSHQPIHEQRSIRGHSVRAMYLLTACADFGGSFLHDAKRLWADAMEKKMYITGGIGSEPQSEGFSEHEYYLPASTAEGGCYAETCASIAAMMVSERILSHELNGKYRDNMELCLYNAVVGGGSLDGKGFSYTNRLATSGDESALRSEWFEVCCCPPNLCRTLGILPGYIWCARTSQDLVEINIYLYISAYRALSLPHGAVVEITMQSSMPWTGAVSIEVKAPESTKVVLRLPVANWMLHPQISGATRTYAPGYLETTLDNSNRRLTISFDMETRLMWPHPQTRSDTLSVMRGPVVFVAEDIDNATLEQSNPHFEYVGICDQANFTAIDDLVAGVPILKLRTNDVYTRNLDNNMTQNGQSTNGTTGAQTPPLYRAVRAGRAVRSWNRSPDGLTLIPWFARGNRGGKGHIRVPFCRVGADHVREDT